MHSAILKKIQKSIQKNLGQKELAQLCTALQISSSGKKSALQDRLLAFLNKQTFETLQSVSNEVDGMLNRYNYKPKQIIFNVQSSKSEFICDDLSQEVLNTALIKLDSEVNMAIRKNLVVVNFTQYSSPQTHVHTKTYPGINERANMLMIPNNLLYVKVKKSPYYCCTVCIHPLCYLVPVQSPHLPQSSRNNSRFSMSFYVSPNVYDLINFNKVMDKNKAFYKWQIVLRFIAIDPSKRLPRPNDIVDQTIPPYLSVSVNNENVALWDILPSNCRAKEGRRHPKPINITDKISTKNHNTSGYKQNVSITWWQTPEIFQYYYAGIYVERKLSLREVMGLFTGDKRDNFIHKNETLRLIRSKLGHQSEKLFGGDDDLVISSVLPISLCCPIGRSRISTPLRTLKCQHLQCFDALLYLSMNERRSQWKCPVCECKATPADLFLCQYTREILDVYKSDDEVIEVNVNIDGTYKPIRQKDKFELDNPIDINLENNGTSEAEKVDLPTIILDSDDESDDEPVKQKKLIATPNKSVEKKKLPVEEIEKRVEETVISSAASEPMDTSSEQTAHKASNNPFYNNASSLFRSGLLAQNGLQTVNNQNDRTKNNEVINALDISFLHQDSNTKSPLKFPVVTNVYRDSLKMSSDDDSINSEEYQDSASENEAVKSSETVKKVESTTFSVSDILRTTSEVTKPPVIAPVTIDLTDDLDDSTTNDTNGTEVNTNSNNTLNQPLINNTVTANPFNKDTQEQDKMNERVRFYSNQIHSKWVPLQTDAFKQNRVTVGDTVNRINGKRKMPSINHMRIRNLDYNANNITNGNTNAFNKSVGQHPILPKVSPLGTTDTIDLTSDDESPPPKKHC